MELTSKITTFKLGKDTFELERMENSKKILYYAGKKGDGKYLVASTKIGEDYFFNPAKRENIRTMLKKTYNSHWHNEAIALFFDVPEHKINEIKMGQYDRFGWSGLRDKRKSFSELRIQGIELGIQSQVGEKLTNKKVREALICIYNEYINKTEANIREIARSFNVDRKNLSETNKGIECKGDVKVPRSAVVDGKLKCKIDVVKGNFIASGLNLTSLDNFPDYVSGNCDCSDNDLQDFSEKDNLIIIAGVLDLSKNRFEYIDHSRRPIAKDYIVKDSFVFYV
jgi:hypothetical protein